MTTRKRADSCLSGAVWKTKSGTGLWVPNNHNFDAVLRHLIMFHCPLNVRLFCDLVQELCFTRKKGSRACSEMVFADLGGYEALR